MSNLRRKMLSTSSQNNNNNNNNNSNGQKFYLFKDGSLQNGAKIVGNSSGTFSPTQKNNIITDEGIKLYGGSRELGLKKEADYPAVKYSFDEAFQKFWEDVIKKYISEEMILQGNYSWGYIPYSQSTREDWEGQGGWGFYVKSGNYGIVTGGECTLYFDEETNFDITKYKTINFLTTDIDEAENAKGSLILTQNYKPSRGPNSQTPEKKEDKTLIEFLEKNDGIKNAALNDNIEGYNAFKFTCDASKGTAYKITEIYLQE